MSVDRAAAAKAIDDFLRALGRDATKDPNLVGTGQRVAEAFAEDFCQGYAVDVDELLAANRLDGQTGVVAVRDVPVTTMCPHHLLPATGKATIAFCPDQHLVGIGVLTKVVDALARRLSLQETIGDDVVGAVMRQIRPRWAGCRLVLTHGCMVHRGDRPHGARVETLAFQADPTVTLPEGEQSRAFQLLGVGT